MVRRGFHCYSCNLDFREMTPIEGIGARANNRDVACPTCHGQFIEEATSFQSETSSAFRPNAPMERPLDLRCVIVFSRVTHIGEGQLEGET